MKTYIFAAFTDFTSGKMTGAHRRFLELLTYVAQNAQVIYVGRKAPMLDEMPNVRCYIVEDKAPGFLPAHLGEGYVLYKKLRQIRKKISWDYAVSFHPVYTICYNWAGYNRIVSLFREDLVGYQKALHASAGKIAYVSIQERLAVKASDKLIVQCENDRKHLIARNYKYCKDVDKKVYIQINNANASWMNTSNVACEKNPGAPKILFIGNFSDRRKGHSLLLPAAMRLLDEGYRFELLLAGDGAEMEAWKQRCSNYREIHFLGRVRNMDTYLRQADFEIVPSLIDSCPNTVLEGMNAGIAVYGANTGGIPDLLQDQAYLFEANDESIYAFMKEVLESKRYLTDVKKQSERKQELCFNWGERIQAVIECS